MTDTKHTPVNIKELRKCASAIYLACPEQVADDVSMRIKQAANEIERLQTINAAMLKALEALLADVECYCADNVGSDGVCAIHKAQATVELAKGHRP